jgi:hypothetical protein
MNGNFKQRESTEILKPGSGDTGFGGHYTQFTVFGGHYAQFTGRNYVCVRGTLCSIHGAELCMVSPEHRTPDTQFRMVSPEPTPNRIELNIPRCRQEVRLIEHERRKPPLPQMASPPLAKVNHPCVTPMDLADRPSQPIRRLRNSDEMDVVRHQAVRPDLNLMGAAPLPHQFQVALVILVAKKRLLPTVSPLGDVVRQARYYNSC